jgi:tetratricopeptide (TPR) repeat protein
MKESFSRTLDTYTGSYVQKRRKKRLLIGLVVLVVLLLCSGSLILLSKGGYLSRGSSGKAVPKKTVLAFWKSRDWDNTLKACETSLQSSPLDSFYVGFAGFSSFYKASELPESEERTALMDQAVVFLRKTLVIADKGRKVDFPKAEIEYVLGKAYYFKGHSYWDETTKWLEASIQDHYVAEDSYEYLAVSYAGLGNTAKAVTYFEAALAQKRSDLLLVAAGKAYLDAGNDAKAESLLLEALGKSSDVLTREKCRFMLASIYETRTEINKAQEQLELVIQENPQSSDAHYRLGLLIQKQGDTVRARAEWRRAVAIDPTNVEARQKLAEKL